MKGFDGLAHRSQKIATVNGITFINDSKATNVESAMMSLNAYENIRWICGGQQKDGGLSKLNSVTQKVRRAYVIGAEAENISKQLTCENVVCGDMRQAVECAVKTRRAAMWFYWLLQHQVSTNMIILSAVVRILRSR